MPGPLTSPYAPGPERMDQALRIADLISRQGRQEEVYKGTADAHRAYAVADLVGGIGKTVMGAWGEIDERKKAAEAQAELRRLLMDPEGFNAREFAARFGIKAAKEAVEFIDAERKAGHKVVEQRDPKKIHVDMDSNETIYEPPAEADAVSRDWARVPDGKGGWTEGRYTDEEINRLGGQRPFSEAEKTRMIADAAAKAQIEELKPLSEKLINHAGLEQRALGVLGKVAAWAGMEDDVRFYQDARRAQATTLAARFQTGNMSEPDIDTWLTLIPDIGKDTRGSAARKWAHIEAIIKGEAPPPDRKVPGSIPDLPGAPPVGNPYVPTTPSMERGNAVMPNGPGDFPPPPAPGTRPPNIPPGPAPGAPMPPPQNMPFTPQDDASRQNLPFNPPNASIQPTAPGAGMPRMTQELVRGIEDTLRLKPPGIYRLEGVGRVRKKPNGTIEWIGP